MNVTETVGSTVFVDDPASHVYEVYAVTASGYRPLIATASGTTLVTVLINLGLAAPAARSMPLAEVVEQVNEVNAGEIEVKRFWM